MKQSVPDLVIDTLKEMGIFPPPGSILHTFALAEGRLVAEKFHYDDGYAVWVADASKVDFYDDEGTLLKTVNVEATQKETAA